MSTFKILQPNERYRGRSYSEWIEEWSNLLVSISPDDQNASEMFFLRGNLDYEPDETGYRIIKPGKFYNRTGSLGQTIYKNTALFIPVMTAMYSVNDQYLTRQLLDEEDLRNAVRRDLSDGREMWLRFKDSKDGYKPVIPKNEITKYYFETAVFTVSVSSQSPLVDKFEAALAAGEHETVQGGYFVILTDLEKGKHRFHFGGNGRGYYYTDAVYDITVLPYESRNLANDVSNKNLTEGKGESIIETQDKERKNYLHLKTEDTVENISPFA